MCRITGVESGISGQIRITVLSLEDEDEDEDELAVMTIILLPFSMFNFSTITEKDPELVTERQFLWILSSLAVIINQVTVGSVCSRLVFDSKSANCIIYKKILR